MKDEGVRRLFFSGFIFLFFSNQKEATSFFFCFAVFLRSDSMVPWQKEEIIRVVYIIRSGYMSVDWLTDWLAGWSYVRCRRSYVGKRQSGELFRVEKMLANHQMKPSTICELARELFIHVAPGFWI